LRNLITLFILIVICNLSHAQSLTERLTGEQEEPVELQEEEKDMRIHALLGSEKTTQNGYRGPVEITSNGLVDLQASGVIPNTVVVRVNGTRIPNGAFVVFDKIGNSQIRLFDTYPLGSYVEVEFKYTNDANNPVGNYLSSSLSSFRNNSPIKIYYGTNDQVIRSGTSLFSGKSIERIIPGDRQEFGFSVNNYAVGDFSFTYGSVWNQERQEGSYRDEFIKSNILNSGKIYTENLSEERSDDVMWREISYGVPNESKVWYQNTYFSIDSQYRTIPSLGASADMIAFLNDPQNWGGRALMQPWYTSSMYSSYWGKNLDPQKGRSELNQFYGITYSYQGFGFRQFDDRIQYSTGTLRQEKTDILTEKLEDLLINIPETGSAYSRIVRNMRLENPTRLNENNEIIQEPTNTEQEYTRTSLTQRLTDEASFSYENEQWRTTDFVTGIEAPSREINKYSINNLGILGAGLTYNYILSRTEGLNESERAIRNLIIEDLHLGNLVSSNIYIKDDLDYMGNLFYRSFIYNIDPIQLSQGFNIPGFKYENKRDNLGASYISRLAQLNGEILGIQWDANINNTTIGPGFRNESSQILNNTENTINREVRNINLSRQFGNFDTRFGYNELIQNRDSHNKTYYIAGRYQNEVLGGNLYLHATQYRNIDKFNVMRPSYDYMATYNRDGTEIGFRRYQHFGAMNEFSFVSDVYWLNYIYKNFNVSINWRHNPILTNDPNASPQIYMGDTQSYSIGYSDTIGNASVNFGASFARNGLPNNNFYSQEWPGIIYYGNLESKTPNFYNWSSNWESAYSLGISFENGSSLMLRRTNTRFNVSAINQITWDVSGTWKISDKDQLTFIYKNWDNFYPRYKQEPDKDLMQGESYTIKYTRFSDASSFSFGITDMGPLEKHLKDKSTLGNEAQQFYQNIPNANYGKDLKWFVEYKCLF